MNLTPEEMKDQFEDDMRRPVHSDVIYPYYPQSSDSNSIQNSGLVTFFNCLQIFYEYVQKVMKQSFHPDCLFDIEEEIIRSIPEEVKKYLISIAYPTPNGIEILSNDVIDTFWGKTEIKDVVLPAILLKNMTSKDIMKRRAVYVVIVKLHELNLLNSSNEPTVEALNKCILVCPALVMESQVKITHRYSNNGGY